MGILLEILFLFSKYKKKRPENLFTGIRGSYRQILVYPVSISLKPYYLLT